MLTTIYLALGTNIWKLDENLNNAKSALHENWIENIKESKRYKTVPMYFEDQDTFINSVIKCETSKTPEELLKLCKDIEKELWRNKTIQNGPRIIDIDILLYGAKRVESINLIIPHDKMFERDFVLVPLYELYPNYIHKDKPLISYIDELPTRSIFI